MRKTAPAPRRRSAPRGRGWLLVAMAAAAAGFALATAPNASADTGQIAAQYQGYTTPGGQDPYASSNPQDVHVGGFGGQPGVTGLIRLNLESLPTGSTIDGLTLVLAPNSSQTDNVEPGQAAIQACILDQPLSSDGYQANPPSYDCNAVHATGEPQPDGSWVFSLAPLADRWQHDGNTGLALVAYPPGNGTPVQAAPSAWSVGFDHTRTAAKVDYTPGSPSGASFGVLPAPASSGSTGTLPAVAPGPAVQALPPVAPAPAVSAAPQPAPAPSSAATGGSGTATPAQAPAAAPHVVAQWVWLTACLGGAAVLMVVVSAMQQLLRTGAVDMRLRLGPALQAARSQLATPVAVLALASVFALGFAGQLTAATGPGATAQGSASGPGGTAGSGSGGGAAGGARGGSSPGATPGGYSAGSAAQGSGGGNASSVSAAQASAFAASNGGRDGPGVTSTTVRIGFIDLTNSQAANQAFGIQVGSQGPQHDIEQTMVDWINHNGGLAGRQIQPVYIQEDNGQAESDPTINEKACKTMTEDYHVFAVIGGAGPPDDVEANSCYASAATLNFDEQWASVSLAFLRAESPYIWFTADTALDRTMLWEVAGLQSRGFFKGGPNYKLGVVIAGDKLNEKIYAQVTQPALQNAGVTNIDTFEVPHDTISDVANTMKQAVAHFQVDGVTNVIFQGGGYYGNGSYATLFLLDAESQHYTPRYGFSTDDGTTAQVQNVPEDQFTNALAIGTIPGIDADDAHYAPWPSTPAEKKCASIEAKTYQPDSRSSVSGSNSALEMLDICSAMLELQQGAQSLVGQPLNAQLWANSAMQLGSSLFNAMAYTADIGPDHWDAPGGYRLLHAVLNCEGSHACFEYDNSTVYH